MLYFNGTTLHFLVSTDNQFCGNVAQNDAKFFVRHSPIFKKKVRVTAPCASLMLAMHQSSEHAQLCNIASINQCRTLTIQLQCYEFFYLWFLCQDNPCWASEQFLLWIFDFGSDFATLFGVFEVCPASSTVNIGKCLIKHCGAIYKKRTAAG